MRKALYGVLALAALLLGILAQRWLTASAPAAEAAPSSELASAFPDLDGVPHRLDEWRGKVLVLNFWATWCPPCLEEMPAFSALQQELGGRGLQFVGLAIDDPESVRQFNDHTPVAYPLLIAESGGEALAARLGNRQGVLPFSAVFDRGGRLITVRSGVYRPEELRRLVEPLLDPGSV